MNKFILIAMILMAGCCKDKNQGAGVSATATIVPCTTSKISGGVVISCPDGTNTTVYDGKNGANGVDGKDGTNASPVVPIQFCPQVGPTTYPNNFPEHGLCINSKLYAVYYSNSAWLAEIVPGIYSTTTTGLNCTFTVAANCEIIN